jgi:CDP-diacylglycerol--serine O-phosphatidyltransferase
MKMKVKIRITKSIVPNLLTLGNLFSGFTSIIYISKGEYEIAAIMILIAGIFDALDGVVARLIRSTSLIGVELDSLCDAVSFGVAPSFLLYSVFFNQIDEFGILFASLPALAGVYRLARFNTQATMEDKNYFKGMPIPAAALFIISYVIFYFNNNSFYYEFRVWGIYFVTFVAAISMISSVKFDNLPRPNWNSLQLHPWNFIISLIGFILSLISGGYFLFPFMVFYVLASYVRAFFFATKKKHKTI